MLLLPRTSVDRIPLTVETRIHLEPPFRNIFIFFFVELQVNIRHTLFRAAVRYLETFSMFRLHPWYFAHKRQSLRPVIYLYFLLFLFSVGLLPAAATLIYYHLILFACQKINKYIVDAAAVDIDVVA